MKNEDISKNEIIKFCYEKWSKEAMPCCINEKEIKDILAVYSLGDNNEDIITSELTDAGYIETLDNFSYAIKFSLINYFESINTTYFHKNNNIRQEIIKCLAEEYKKDVNKFTYNKDVVENISETNQLFVFREVQYLNNLGIIIADFMMGNTYLCKITPSGYQNYARKEEYLEDEFPTNWEKQSSYVDATDNVLYELHTSIGEIFVNLKWDSAKNEFNQGDNELEKGNWLGAVREYYSSLESAIKYKLKDANINAKQSESLKTLTSRLIELDFIPINYKSIFDFVDSIRSPRSHGKGPLVIEVPVGEREALLMKNYISSLIIYLAQAPIPDWRNKIKP